MKTCLLLTKRRTKNLAQKKVPKKRRSTKPLQKPQQTAMRTRPKTRWNMPTMTMPLAPVPGGEPGVYRFRTNLAMAGGWALTLTAKVQGEEGTVENRLVFRATP